MTEIGSDCTVSQRDRELWGRWEVWDNSWYTRGASNWMPSITWRTYYSRSEVTHTRNTYIHIYIHSYIHTCTCNSAAVIHTYIHTYIHTHIHTHTHTYSHSYKIRRPSLLLSRSQRPHCWLLPTRPLPTHIPTQFTPRLRLYVSSNPLTLPPPLASRTAPLSFSTSLHHPSFTWDNMLRARPHPAAWGVGFLGHHMDTLGPLRSSLRLLLRPPMVVVAIQGGLELVFPWTDLRPLLWVIGKLAKWARHYQSQGDTIEILGYLFVGDRARQY